ncbi:MAG: SCO family protein [Nitrospirota bacterium]
MSSKSRSNSRRYSLSVWAAFILLILSAWAEAGVRAPSFEGIGFDGRPVKWEALRGKAILLAFSYSNCQVTCPIIMGRFLDIDETLSSPQDLLYVQISVDPEGDTQANIRKYFKIYAIDPEQDKRWLFLYASRGVLEPVWKAYGITIEKKVWPVGYEMIFTPKVVAIDRGGTIRKEWDGFDFPEEEAVSILKKLLEEKPR